MRLLTCAFSTDGRCVQRKSKQSDAFRLFPRAQCICQALLRPSLLQKQICKNNGKRNDGRNKRLDEAAFYICNLPTCKRFGLSWDSQEFPTSFKNLNCIPSFIKMSSKVFAYKVCLLLECLLWTWY